jgi:hypothetical protein
MVRGLAVSMYRDCNGRIGSLIIFDKGSGKDSPIFFHLPKPYRSFSIE